MLPSPVADQPTAPPPRSASRLRLAVVVAVAVVGLAVAAVLELRPQGRPDAPAGSWTLVPHQGLGAWVDAYDWTTELGGATPSVGPEDIDAMAEAGIQTLYIQTAHERASAEVLEPERLDEIIDRAHANDIHVVAWYLPTLVDLDRDLQRLVAASELAVDGLGVDIESVEVADPAERTRRVLELSTRLRAAVGDDRALAAITLSSVHLDVVNPTYWPGYPWARLGETYDAVLPMAYWSIRRGDLRAGGRYVGENIDRIRAAMGDDVLPIHPIGGIADDATVAHVQEMVAAIQERGAMGGSLYDWNTSTDEQWVALQPLRDLRVDG